MVKKADLEFFDDDRHRASLGPDELRFFSYMVMNPAKILYSLFILKAVILHADLAGVYLMALGFARGLLGVTPQLTHTEYLRFCRAAIGFLPSGVRRLEDGIEMRICPQGYFMSGVVQVFYFDQYRVAGKNMDGMVVVDAGANQGLFSIFAARLGARKIYAFEPVKETFEMLKRNIKANGLEKKVVPLNLALGESDCDAEIAYDYSGDGGASLVFKESKLRKQAVKVLRLDGFARGKRIDFIKIDAEGYEAEILSGARKTIARHKPLLAFSAYHKQGDKEALPALVKAIRRDYTCRLETACEDDIICE